MLSLGVVGLGYWGPNLARNAVSSPRFELSHICDLDDHRLDAIGRLYPAVQRWTDPRGLLESDVDAVAIATPVDTHYELARAALEAGKHVLVEKPFVAQTAHGQELISLARERGVQLMVDHVFLFSPAVVKLLELAGSGELGDVQYVDSVRVNLGIFQHDVNVLWDLAPHDLSIMDTLIGRSPQSVVAFGSSHSGDGHASVAYLHLDYGDNLIGSVHVNWASPVKIRHFLVGGSSKSVLYNDLDRSEPVKVYDRGVDITPDPDRRRARLVSYRSGDVVSPKVAGTEPLQAMIGHFAECIETGREPLSSAAQGLRVVQILEAANASMKSGGTRVEL